MRKCNGVGEQDSDESDDEGVPMMRTNAGGHLRGQRPAAPGMTSARTHSEKRMCKSNGVRAQDSNESDDDVLPMTRMKPTATWCADGASIWTNPSNAQLRSV